MIGAMRYVNFAVIALLVILVAGVLHYTLPQNDVVRIVNTDVRRVDFGNNTWFWAQSDAGSATRESRDVRFIESIRPDGAPMVYRNEDTGWGWPPYLKFNSANLQTHAQDLVSTREAPQWVLVRHYGWRSEWLSIFPNAVAVRAVDGPDASIFPWRAVVALVGLVLLVVLLMALLRLLRMTFLDPVVARFRRRP